MPQLNNNRRRQLVVVALLIIALFAVAGSAQAQAMVRGNSIDAGETVEADAFLTGDDIVVDGTVDGDVIAIGNNVTINGTVQGSLVVIGDQVVVNGEVAGSTYVAGVNLTLGEASSVDRSVFFIGSRLSTEPDSQVSRDLAAFTLGADMRGGVGRDVRATIGILELLNRIFARLDQLPADALSIGQLSQGAGEAIARLDGPRRGVLARTSNSPTASTLLQDGSGSQNGGLGDWGQWRLRWLVSYLIVGGLAAWWFPSLISGWAKKLREKPLAATGAGLVATITGFGAAPLLAALVFAIGLALRLVTLRTLSLTIWGIGFSGVALAFSIFMLFVIFVSKVVVSYTLGLLILERLWSRAAAHKAWPLLLGLIIYVLLSGIPVLGWALGIIVVFLGLGAVSLLYVDRGREESVLVLEEE